MDRWARLGGRLIGMQLNTFVGHSSREGRNKGSWGFVEEAFAW